MSQIKKSNRFYARMSQLPIVKWEYINEAEQVPVENITDLPVKLNYLLHAFEFHARQLENRNSLKGTDRLSSFLQ